ncbi:MAG: long-chain-fatty-acid--CoA ligase [Actinobacteria bacterium]|nr:MAG: long-chain-fatty-acid--CoA ligase [Actinomycetota bacterium]
MVALTLKELLQSRAAEMGERTAVIYKDDSISYRELEARVNRFANALAGLGVGRDDKVAIMLNNCPEFIVTFFACSYLGAVAVPVNIFYKERELEFLLRDSDAVALVATPSFAEFFSRIAEKPPLFKWLITTEPYAEGQLFRELEGKGSGEPLDIEVREEDVAEILYTSGTTGIPKGTMLTQGNLFFHADAIIGVLELNDDDRALMVVPMFHGYGITVMLCCFVVGTSFVLLDPFNAEEVFQVVEKYKVTFLPMVVAMYFMVYHHPDREKYDLSSLRIGISGASAMPAQLMQDASGALDITILEAWGLTECSASATIQRMNMPYKEGSVGLAHPGVKVGVMDDGGNLLGPSEVGELVIQGPLVMKGYYKRPEETEEALREGWLHTGDMGYYDDEGYFFMVDRKKEMVNVGGEKVFPREVEEVMYTHPAIAEAALIPQPDAKLGEIPVAVVALKPGASLSEGELVEFLEGKLARFKVPRRVVIMESLPRNPIGKIVKKDLVRMLSEE